MADTDRAAVCELHYSTVISTNRLMFNRLFVDRCAVLVAATNPWVARFPRKALLIWVRWPTNTLRCRQAAFKEFRRCDAAPASVGFPPLPTAAEAGPLPLFDDPGHPTGFDHSRGP